MKRYKLGIALGGGGVRGFAHLGVLKALEEKGIVPDVISSVSAGALVGVFIASGQSPDRTMDLMKEYKLTDFAKITMPVNGLLNLENLEKILKEQIEAKQIEDLNIPFFVTVTNLLEGKVEYKNKGSLIHLIQASASIPVLFAPVSIKRAQYVDGGLMDNLPIKPLESNCEKIIAISISPVQKVKKVENLVEVAARTFQLSVNNHINEIDEKCDLFIEPKGLENFGLLDTSHADELFELGYKCGKQVDVDELTIQKT